MPRSVESLDVDPLETPLPVDPDAEPVVPLDCAPLAVEPEVEPLAPVPLDTEPLPIEPDDPLEPVPLETEPLPVVPDVLPLVDPPPVTPAPVSVDPDTLLPLPPGVLVLDLGDAAGLCAAACASRLHASKSACVGAASAIPDMLKNAAAAASAHALLLRFMIGPPRWK